GYDRDKIVILVDLAKKHGIELIAQPDDYQGDFKISFYYKINHNMESDFAWLKKSADKTNSRILFTKCNPSAGDPTDCYDVEFIPICCGKDETVSFVMKELGVKKNSIYSFGDSCNDFPMFSRSGNSYLVSNADPVAVKQHGERLDKPYCHGILSVLKGIK
ncbi:MAG: HAD hydrolase family protein, partial [Colwellia sp.]